MSNDNNQKNLIETAVDLHKNGQINKALNLYLELIKNTKLALKFQRELPLYC